MKKMKGVKNWIPFYKQLIRMGYKGEAKKISMTRWRFSASPLVNIALPNKLFDKIGLINL